MSFPRLFNKDEEVTEIFRQLTLQVRGILIAVLRI